jgi:hypothetical protein
VTVAVVAIVMSYHLHFEHWGRGVEVLLSAGSRHVIGTRPLRFLAELNCLLLPRANGCMAQGSDWNEMVLI